LSGITGILPNAANAPTWYNFGYFFTMQQTGLGPMTFDLTSIDFFHPGLPPGAVK
jgi:hypothetical protein